MDVFRHEDFASILLSLATDIVHGQFTGDLADMVDDAEAFDKALESLLVSAKIGQHIAVDMHSVPDAPNPGDKWPFPPFEEMVFGMANNTRARFEDGGSVFDAVVTFMTYEDDDYDKKQSPSLIMVPFRKDTTHNKGKYKGLTKWHMYPVAAHYRYNEAQLFLGAAPGIIPETVTAEEMYRNLGEAVAAAVRDVLYLINCENVVLYDNEPSQLRKMRAKKKQQWLKSYSTIQLPGDVRTVKPHGGGHHASPRLHHRRGHYRTYHRGENRERTVWVRSAVVGSSRNGIVEHTYVVQPKKEHA